MASGPAEVVQAPPLSPPGQGLLLSAEVIDDPNAAHWVEGVTFSPEVCSGTGLYALCGATPTDPGNTRTANRSFEPFVVFQDDECSTFGFEQADYEGRARRGLLAHESAMVEAEFWSGALLSANAHLAQPNAVNFPLAQPRGSTAQASRVGLAVLDQAIADARVGLGMIHVPPILLALLVGNQQLRWDGRRWISPMGNVVVGGSGYPGSAPDGTGGGDQTVQWAYATDLVQVIRGPITTTPETMAQALNRSTNVVTFRAERPFAVLWSGCAHAAVKITIA